MSVTARAGRRPVPAWKGSEAQSEVEDRDLGDSPVEAPAPASHAGSRFGNSGGASGLGGDKRPITFQLTREERKPVYLALKEMKEDAETESQAVALEHICVEFLSGPSLGRASIPETGANRTPARFWIYPDQEKLVADALEKAGGDLVAICQNSLAWRKVLGRAARESAGCKDDRDTLADGRSPFVDQREKNFGGPEWPGSAQSGHNQGEERPGHPQRHRIEPHTSHYNEASYPSQRFRDPRRRVDHSPKPAHRVERAERQDRSGSIHSHQNGGGAVATFARGAQHFGAGLAPRELTTGIKLVGPFPRFPVDTVGTLAQILGRSECAIRDLSQSAEDRYVPGWVPKRRGGWRQIDKPDDVLKVVQRGMLDRLFAQLVDSPIAYGVHGATHIDAARRHARQLFVGTADIARFFASVTCRVIRDFFGEMGCSPDLADVLTALLTYGGRLPQGSPASPAVATLLLSGVDRRVYAESQRLGLRTTRFADDWGASGEDRGAVVQLLTFIEGELKPLGLGLNRAKTAIMARHEPQIVLGLSVNNGVSIPKPYRAALERDVFKATKDGCTDDERQRLGGQIDYVAKLHPKQARKMEAMLRSAPVKGDGCPGGSRP